jgi:hypothetical protein
MLLFFGLPILVFFIMGVIHASETLSDIKAHWAEYRCNPIYLPFAGMIDDKVSVEENFQHCLNMMGQSVFSIIIDGIMGSFKQLGSSFLALTGSLGGFREVIVGIRKFMLSFATQTFGKIVNSLSSFTFILAKIKDILGRFVGQGYISAFLAKTGIDFIVSFIFAIIAVIKGFVFALLAISIILALFNPVLLVFAIVMASLIGASGF